jgi:hypothetical protein
MTGGDAAARPRDRRAQPLLRHLGEDDHPVAAVLPRRETVDHRVPQIRGQLDPAGTLGLRDGRLHEPRLAVLVEVGDGRLLKPPAEVTGRP